MVRWAGGGTPLLAVLLALSCGPSSTSSPTASPSASTSGLLAGTWVFAHSKWIPIAARSEPPPRSGAAMAYDPAHRVTLLFGGAGETGYLADTWTWDGTRWRQLSPARTPTGRSGGAMAFDAAHGVMVLFAGVEVGRGEGSEGNDLWTWDGTDWTPARPPAVAPAARTGPVLFYDPGRKAMIASGGNDGNVAYFADTWAWDGSGWAELKAPGAPPRGQSAYAHDSARSKLVSFGGIVSRAGAGIGNQGLPTAGTFEFDGTAWSDRSSSSDPSARSQAAMAYDQGGHRVLMFGGFTCPQPSGELWSWDGKAWSLVRATGGPSARWGASMAYDEAHSQIVLFGGSSAGC